MRHGSWLQALLRKIEHSYLGALGSSESRLSLWADSAPTPEATPRAPEENAQVIDSVPSLSQCPSHAGQGTIPCLGTPSACGCHGHAP